MKAQSVSGVLAAAAALISLAAGDCSRAFLVDAANKYVTAQAEGKPAILAAIAADNLNYTESNKPVDIKTGVLAQPMKIDHSSSNPSSLCLILAVSGSARVQLCSRTAPVTPQAGNCRLTLLDSPQHSRYGLMRNFQ